MKKIVLIAAFVLASASAHAGSYGDGGNRVVIPDGCSSWSCMSVTIPGHFHHNDSQPAAKHTQAKGNTTSHNRDGRHDHSACRDIDACCRRDPGCCSRSDRVIDAGQRGSGREVKFAF